MAMVMKPVCPTLVDGLVPRLPYSELVLVHELVMISVKPAIIHGST